MVYIWRIRSKADLRIEGDYTPEDESKMRQLELDIFHLFKRYGLLNLYIRFEPLTEASKWKYNHTLSNGTTHPAGF